MVLWRNTHFTSVTVYYNTFGLCTQLVCTPTSLLACVPTLSAAHTGHCTLDEQPRCASGVYTSWWPRHWTDTQSYDSVHTSHSSAQNEHKLCGLSVKIHRRHSGEASDVSSTHEQRSHSRVCGCNTVACPNNGPCKRSKCALLSLFVGTAALSIGTTEFSGWSGRIPTGISVSGVRRTNRSARAQNFGPACKCPCLVESNATTFSSFN
jgi:hypothetical protein